MYATLATQFSEYHALFKTNLRHSIQSLGCCDAYRRNGRPTRGTGKQVNIILGRTILIMVAVLAIVACSSTDKRVVNTIPLPGSPEPGTEADIAELASAIAALGADISVEEAETVARISYEHTYDLALQYEITDTALVHNVKVNLGIKPRGLCRQWAVDMEKRFGEIELETLEIHRAIGALVGIDHSTVIVSRRGESMYDGIVIDPWRKGGTLTWVRTREDTQWGWEPQFSELDRSAYDLALENGQDTIVYSIDDKPPRCLVVADGRPQSRQITSSTNLARCAKGEYRWMLNEATFADGNSGLLPPS